MAANKADYGFHPANEEANLISPVRVDTTTAFKRFDPLVIGSTGYELAVAGSSYIDAVAAFDSTGVTDGAQLGVHICSPGATFICRADGATNSLIVGSEVDIIGASGAVMADADASTTNVLIVRDPHPDNDDDPTVAGAKLLVSMFQRSRT